MSEIKRRKKSKITIDDSHFKIYIKKVLKQVHPDTGITSAAISYIEDILEQILKSLINTSSRLLRSKKLHTIDSRDIQSAVMIIIPGNLSKHAVSEATKAISKYMSPSKKEKSQSIKAGLIFPVGRIKTLIKKISCNRISKNTPVYTAAVLEYLAAELLELAGNEARNQRKKRVQIEHINKTIENDEELKELFKDFIFGCKKNF